MQLVNQLQTLLRRASYARKQGGRGFLSQLRDLKEIRRLPGLLSVGDYYDLRLYEIGDEQPDELSQYMGWQMNGELDKLFNENAWRATANDKVLMYSLLHEARVPIPETVAVFSPSGRLLPGAKTICSSDEFIAFLKDIEAPVFFKPICGTYGRSSFAITHYEHGSEQWRLADNSTLTMEKLQRILAFPPYHGILVQKILRPHDSVRRLTGQSTSCVRLNVLRNDGSPELFNAFWKISVGNNMTDNFSGGKHGNIIASVDVFSGEITRVIDGLAEDYNEITAHPTTGEHLKGFKLPDFESIIPIIQPAVVALEGLNFQHWDVAFTDKGPVAMEINLEPDLHIIQLLRGRGILSDHMQQHIKAQRDRLERSRSAIALRADRPELEL